MWAAYGTNSHPIGEWSHNVMGNMGTMPIESVPHPLLRWNEPKEKTESYYICCNIEYYRIHPLCPVYVFSYLCLPGLAQQSGL